MEGNAENEGLSLGLANFRTGSKTGSKGRLRHVWYNEGNALGTTNNIDIAALKGQGNTPRNYTDRPEGEDRNTVPLPLQGG